jgi:hypothetical protein
MDFAQAVFDTSAGFGTPEAVRDHPELSREQKIQLLRVWQYDATSVAVAEEEGMIGSNDLLVQRIVHTLHQLTGGVDVAHTRPTKHQSLKHPSERTLHVVRARCELRPRHCGPTIFSGHTQRSNCSPVT